MNNVFSIGSCRINHIINNSPNDFLHTTKEVLQLIYLLENKDNLQYSNLLLRLVNRNYSHKRRIIYELNRVKNELNNSTLIVIEISSLKEVYNKINKLYFNIDLFNTIINKPINLKKNKSSLRKVFPLTENIKKNTIILKQTKNILYDDLKKIYNYFVVEKNKKILLIPHINATFVYKNNNKFKLQPRVLICNTLNEFSMEQNNCYYFDPMNYLQDDYLTIFEKDSSGHYTEKSKQIIEINLNKIIKNIIN
tara:strand:+ start:998 stop:1750 length:753 start_codon:yes stop_codon:yes gene_type:complete